MVILFLLLFASHACYFGIECNKGRSSGSSGGGFHNSPYELTTEEPYDKHKPGITKQTFKGDYESSWVPGISAAVIIIIVFLISLFACCIHCPFCFVYRRNEPQRIV